MNRRRRWEILALGIALMITFVTLVVVGTQRPGSSANTLVGTPAPQAVPHTDVAPPQWMRKIKAGEKPPQFIVFSFDGAGSHEHWQKMLPLARGVNAHFSGFLSGIYLLDDSRRAEYTGPGHKPGKASIGFGGTKSDVTNLVGDLNQAVEQGHEIGTHYNGHFCKGAEPSVGKWGADGWNNELDQFFKFMDGARDLGLKVDPRTVKGGRTPCLEGQFNVLMPTLAARDMTYDSSQVSDGLGWPTQQSGVWEFFMPAVKVPGANYRKTILMDYNFWFMLNKAKDEPARAPEFTKIALDTYERLYQAAYDGNRAPMVVGNHFNNWTGGAFMTAVEKFMGSACAKPETVCATYTEVINWMKLQDPAVLDTFRKMPNAQVEPPA
ncbi:polysaccharide deacetylase [Actinokineospora sp. HUAS TT18]|uniref:polysaccharide deacetylase n=1 Tax=Actinokineospora sp. HUAS TT18 TaxID=3447451 RepID=UPI003F51DE30